MTQVAILGAGITGLVVGWQLQKLGVDFIILEKHPYIGGLARSFKWHGFDCDIGAHRLFSSDQVLLNQLGKFTPLRQIKRQSVIYLQGKWLEEPLNVLELVRKIPCTLSSSILWDYISRPRDLTDDNFENYVIRRYGRRLNDLFFAPYTEKLFGLSGKEISPMWAWKKVRLASPFDPYLKDTRRKFNSFYYPINGGYGSIAKGIFDEIKDRVYLKSEVIGFGEDNGQIVSVSYFREGQQFVIPVKKIISTLSMNTVTELLGFGSKSHYKKISCVYLLANRPMLSKNHWEYFVDRDISINRLVEFNNFDNTQIPHEQTALCAEVTFPQSGIVEKVITDIARIGLLEVDEIKDVLLLEEEFSYPLYDRAYEKSFPEILNQLSQYRNLYQAGRAAEFNHLETDDCWVTAMDAAKWATQPSEVAAFPGNDMVIEKIYGQRSRVYVVVLSYNQYEDTYECLKSIYTLKYKDIGVVLVDNGSSDGTVQKVAIDFPDVHLIKIGSNLGVPAGYNKGFEFALSNGAEYILMLNNDTILSEDMLSELIAVAENDPETGIVMPKVLYYGTKDMVWSSGGRYRRFPPAILMTDRRRSANSPTRMIDFAPGCGLLIHRKAFEHAGLFDPGFFFLFDDWDFSKRVRDQGLHIWYTSRATLWHKVSRTSKGPSSPLYWQMLGTSSVRYYRKHGHPSWISLPIHMGYLILREFVWKRNWKYWPHFLTGIKTGLRSRLPGSDVRDKLG